VPQSTLIELVTRDAETEIRRVADAATAEVAAIREAAHARDTARVRSRVAARAAELHAHHARMVAQARHAARADILAARAAFVDRVLSVARALLAGLDDAPLIPRLIAEAEAYLPPGAIVVPEPERKGVRLESTDGRVVVDNTLARRLERLRPVLAIAIMAGR